MVSDGSFKNRWFKAALIIEGGKTYHMRIIATSTTPGHTKYQEIYTSEISIIIYAIMIIKKICSKFNITEGETTAACGDMDAIIMEMEKYTSFSIKPNHFEILSVIDAKLKQSTIQWN